MLSHLLDLTPSKGTKMTLCVSVKGRDGFRHLQRRWIETLMSHDLAKAPRGFALLALHITLSDSTQK